MPFEILQRRESRRHRPLKLPGSSSPPVISASNSGAAKTSKTLWSAAENQTDPKQESTSSSTNGPVNNYLVDVALPQFPREKIFQSLGKWYGTRQHHVAPRLDFGTKSCWHLDQNNIRHDNKLEIPKLCCFLFQGARIFHITITQGKLWLIEQGWKRCVLVNSTPFLCRKKLQKWTSHAVWINHPVYAGYRSGARGAAALPWGICTKPFSFGGFLHHPTVRISSFETSLTLVLDWTEQC